MSQTFSFLEHEALPTPDVSPAQAETVLQQHYGIVGTATKLGSQQDANFRIESSVGTFVLKVSNPAFTWADLEAQDRAAAHIQRFDDTIAVSTSVPGSDGATIHQAEIDGTALLIRLMTFLDGGVLSESDHLATSVVASLGDLVARTSIALAEFDGPVPRRELQWDLRHAHHVVGRLAGFVDIAGGPDAALEAVQAAHEALARVSERLPVQVIHGDLTDDNVVAAHRHGRRHPVGLIDFGDLTESWAVGELAVTCATLLSYGGGVETILPAVTAFDRVRSLSDDELEAFWPLVVLRAAVLLVSGQHQVSIDQDNDYAVNNLERERRIFTVATSVPLEVMTELVRSTIRLPFSRPTATGSPIVSGSTLVPMDVSTTSPHLDGGVFLEGDAEQSVSAAVLAASADLAYIPAHQRRLTRTRTNDFDAPSNVALGVELFASRDTELFAPWPGRIEIAEDAVVVRGDDGHDLWLSGPIEGAAPGSIVGSGEPIGILETRGVSTSLRVQVSRGPGRPPFFVTAAMAEAWAWASPDPTPLIDPGGWTDSLQENAHPLLERRNSSFAPVQEHYFSAPPQIERGWKQHLFDVDGRAYLDMLNNVSILGHGHPQLADAIQRQWRLLNTNSRFHYRSVVELSERLSALLPEPLDTVFLVNSGSEAVDLALRLAWAHTGRRDVVAVREAYHGWTDATDAISTSIADNPQALETRPEWVHAVAAPNAYRGQYRGAEAHRYAEDAVAHVREMVVSGTPPAAFLCEPYYGNAGGMALPDGYLDTVYEAVRAAGGLCIADEVQVGYGRLGQHFWGFQQQGVVPDVVAVAKAMGNGHPLGAVITTKQIAASYRSQGYFFSSAGGSPVSSVVGLTVLDVLRDEGLQDNARVVGDHLRERLLGLAERHSIIGAVHGMGLYIGVEMVRDRRTLEPATAETVAICDRMRDLGVIMQPTSDRQCVLKIKPPLGITIADADFFADTLDRVLTEGW
ncbi:aminotransferase [Phycicoccus sp. Root101]|uniref:aminotransferase n=1 Tax=Phycicoccus sp. Root101 TaxID=1736421 RepID=UPI0007035360|nr:aminotransferase [Phycicoccus sp. Root101]KQU70170.1 4-aminobutyrate aminotransferase [Phycicoccus sp. Root101]